MPRNPLIRYVRGGVSIDLNMTLPDFGRPDLPGLRDEVRLTKAGDLLCCNCLRVNAENEANGVKAEKRTGWVYVQERKGNLYAVHLHPGEAAHMSAPESDLHKRWKEFFVVTAVGAGLKAEAEKWAGPKVRSDVQVTGGAVDLSLEAELKKSSVTGVIKRSENRLAQGLAPLWVTGTTAAPLLYKVPSAGTDSMAAWRQCSGLDTRVLAGVRVTKAVRCGDDGRKCPLTRRKPCGERHLTLVPVQGSHIDKLIIGAASGEFRSLMVKNGNAKNYFWLPLRDYLRYTGDLGIDEVVHEVGDDDADPVPRPLKETEDACRESDLRESPLWKKRLSGFSDLARLERLDGECWCGRGLPARHVKGKWLCREHERSGLTDE